MNLRKKAHLPEGIVRRIWDPTSFVSSTGRLGDLAPTLAAISRRHTTGRDVRTQEIQRLVNETGHLDNSGNAVPPSGDVGGSAAHSGDGGGSAAHSGDVGEYEEPGEPIPMLGAHPTANIYTAMSGALLVSCHAQMYKQVGRQCPPTAQFSDLFTSMNQ